MTKTTYLSHDRIRRLLPLILATSTLLVPALATPASASTWDRLAACEASGNWSANTGNGFYGGLQFTNQTWRGFDGTRYAARADQASPQAQVTIAKKVLRAQGPGAWPTCAPRAGLTRTASSSTTSRSVARGQVVIPYHHNDNGGLVVDGIIGPLTRAEMRRYGLKINSRSQIRRTQRIVGVCPDGIVGPRTARAIQRWINLK